MTASERSALASNIAHTANDLALTNGNMRISCFECTREFMTCEKSACDEKIKPQGAMSKINIADMHNCQQNQDFYPKFLKLKKRL